MINLAEEAGMLRLSRRLYFAFKILFDFFIAKMYPYIPNIIKT